MITLRKCNFFTGTPNNVSNVVSKIVKFLELDGYNHLLITPPNSTGIKDTNTGICRSLPGYLEFRSFDDFENLISDKSNLFRINLLIFDFWYSSKEEIRRYRYLIDKLDIKYIILSKEFEYKESEDISDYHVEVKYSDFTNSPTIVREFKSDIFLTDKKNGWKSTLDALKTSYIRDKKIDSLFDDENE
jgi:hypothetical protein